MSKLYKIILWLLSWIIIFFHDYQYNLFFLQIYSAADVIITCEKSTIIVNGYIKE